MTTDYRPSRRRLLRDGLFGFSLAATAPHFLDLTSRVMAGETGDGARILVVLQLSGGNDGLSMIVPHGDRAYHAARRASAIPEREVKKVDAHLGFHPALEKMHGIFQDGRLAVVHGVGYPNPNRSHFESMDIWHAGDLRGRSVPTGWIGRAVDSCCPAPAGPTTVVNVGGSVPYALEAEVNKPVSFEAPDEYAWAGEDRDRKTFEELNDPAEHANDQIEWLHRVSVDARSSSDRVRRLAGGYRPKAEYPGNQLARDLRIVAALIAGGLDTRVYYVSFGGFDTHNAQRGRHDNLMRQLDAAVGAFHADLRAQGLSERVLVVSFSEFGRRVQENGSGGTDHGVAGPMLLIGDAVKGGLHGRHPSLTDLDRGDLKMTTDFRSVYASVLKSWMGVDPARVLNGRFPTLPLLA